MSFFSERFDLGSDIGSVEIDVYELIYLEVFDTSFKDSDKVASGIVLATAAKAREIARCLLAAADVLDEQDAQ